MGFEWFRIHISNRFSYIYVSGSTDKSRMLDITRDKPIKVAVRVVVPVRDHPKVRTFIFQYPSALPTLNIRKFSLILSVSYLDQKETQ